LGPTQPAAQQPLKQPATSQQATPALEPGDVASGCFNQPVSRKNRCTAVSLDGAPCRAFAHGQSDHCIFHDPDYRQTLQAHSALGGRKSGQARARSAAQLVPVDVSTPAARLEFIGYALAAILQGRCSAPQTAALHRFLSLAHRQPVESDASMADFAQFFGRRPG
jgi:hypothetical protein